MRRIHCVVLDAEADALEEPPYPGDLGQRIFDTVFERRLAAMAREASVDHQRKPAKLS